MSRFASFVAAGIGGVAGAAIGGEAGRMVRGYALTDSFDEIMGAIVGGAIFAALAAEPVQHNVQQAGVSGPPPLPRQVRMP